MVKKLSLCLCIGVLFFIYLRLLRRGQGTAVEQPPVTGPGRFSAEPPGSRLPGLLLTAGLNDPARLELAESPQRVGLFRRTPGQQ